MICVPVWLAITGSIAVVILLSLGWSIAFFATVGLRRTEAEVASLRRTVRAFNWPAQ